MRVDRILLNWLLFAQSVHWRTLNARRVYFYLYTITHVWGIGLIGERMFRYVASAMKNALHETINCKYITVASRE